MAAPPVEEQEPLARVAETSDLHSSPASSPAEAASTPPARERFVPEEAEQEGLCPEREAQQQRQRANNDDLTAMGSALARLDRRVPSFMSSKANSSLSREALSHSPKTGGVSPAERQAQAEARPPGFALAEPDPKDAAEEEARVLRLLSRALKAGPEKSLYSEWLLAAESRLAGAHSGSARTAETPQTRSALDYEEEFAAYSSTQQKRERDAAKCRREQSS